MHAAALYPVVRYFFKKLGMVHLPKFAECSLDAMTLLIDLFKNPPA